MPIISIPKSLREKLGEEATASLVEMMNQFGQENKESVVELAEQRYEAKLTKVESGIRGDMAAMESRFGQKLTKVESGIRGDMAAMESRIDQRITQEISGLREEMVRSDLAVRDELKEEIHKHGTATIKWMFIFWVGQIGALLGILFAVFK